MTRFSSVANESHEFESQLESYEFESQVESRVTDVKSLVESSHFAQTTRVRSLNLLVYLLYLVICLIIAAKSVKS